MSFFLFVSRRTLGGWGGRATFVARATESVAILAKIALFCIFSAKNLDLSINFAFLQKRDFQHKKTDNYEEVFTYPYSRDFLLAERGFCAILYNNFWRRSRKAAQYKYAIPFR